MPAVIPLLGQLMALQDQRELTDAQVSRAMGIHPSTLTNIKRAWNEGKGSHILTITAYAKVIGWPLTPVEDPNYAPPPAVVTTEDRIKEAARLRNEGLSPLEISKRMHRDRDTIYQYLKAAKARNLIAP
ncbi:helix-turn-helix domain-containing protein [Nonomuraea sp. SYSU D8015]|uniref:helix-turn-helix domain-containing protein n=1 Tax=Nonomuraea sp. SYSU D8015 TaxID=2593644 RepID=UPI0016604CB4|nr:helix-turn-helix domain-containing protein [Nonomuraea sp. SYSU D8015]